uniref:Galectin n=1 Tax=Sinocyclocheilus rhinocerous TaxID=307959 RepID=A0A673MUX7_9TELE
QFAVPPLNNKKNKTIPYMGPISGGLREGMALYLQGVVPANADRFRINFKTGPTDKHETAFHFNPRMGSKVVMNSFSTGKWETEESFSDNPFKKGEDFDMFFVVKSEGYQVHVNGKELYTFKHRIALEKVKITLTITVFQISILTNLNPASRLGLMHIFLCLLQTLPYVAPIPGGLREGMALYLQGVVPTNADRFSINFKIGPTDKHDIAFHFSPRMDRKVAMNSFRNGKWGAEESLFAYDLLTCLVNTTFFLSYYIIIRFQRFFATAKW